MMLFRRIVHEKRRLIWPLGIALVANVAIYLVAVYPLARKVEAARTRADRIAVDVRRAEQGHTQARAMIVGKARADEELRKFYTSVLPADLSGARRITYLRLAQMAEQAGLRYERRTVTADRDSDSALSRLHMSMVLAGEYADVRQFIYRLETAPEFVVIEEMALAQGAERDSPLVLTLQLSTYYRASSDGT